MFDIGWGELLVIGMVALIAIGPKELPAALRTLGQWMNKVRRMAGEFQNQFHEAMREAELADLKKEVDEMASTASKFSSLDPLEQTRKEVESALGVFPDSPTASTSSATPTTTSSEDVAAATAQAQSELPPPPAAGEAALPSPEAPPPSASEPVAAPSPAVPAAAPSPDQIVADTAPGEVKPDTGAGAGGRAA